MHPGPHEEVDPFASKQRIINAKCLELRGPWIGAGGVLEATTLPYALTVPVLGWLATYQEMRVEVPEPAPVVVICRRLLASWTGAKLDENAADTLERICDTLEFPRDDGGEDLRGEDEGARAARRFRCWETPAGEPLPPDVQDRAEAALAVATGREEATHQQARRDPKAGMTKWRSTSKKGRK